MHMVRTKLVLFFGVLVFFVPSITRATVIINEVAWMGTSVSANDEWIELHNDGTGVVSLDGWTLEWDKETTSPRSVPLSGSIGANGYYLLERTDDETVTGVSADVIFAGPLGNTGENFLLKNANGDVVQTVDALAGWPAGDNTTKDTMQRAGSAWVTAIATPRRENAASGAAPTPTEGASSSSGSATPSAHASGSALSSVIAPPDSISIDIGRDRSVMQHMPITFSARVLDQNNNPLRNTYVSWSFGDGAAASEELVTHTYLFPGEYVVVARVLYGFLEATNRVRVSVTPFSIEIIGTEVGQDGYISLRNSATREVNIGNLVIRNDGKDFLLPENTILLPSSNIAISAGPIGAPVGRELALITPRGRVMQHYGGRVLGAVTLGGDSNTNNLVRMSETLTLMRRVLEDLKKSLTTL